MSCKLVASNGQPTTCTISKNIRQATRGSKSARHRQTKLKAAMDAMEPESENLGSEKFINDAGDVEVTIAKRSWWIQRGEK